MASRKRKEREREVEAALQDERDYAHLVSRPGSDFFVIDNAATVSAKILARRAKRARQKLRTTKTARDSKSEARLVEKMVAKVRRRREETPTSAEEDVEVNDDLWGPDDGDVPKKKSTDVAAPGQSYNPSLEDHQELVRTAVAVETKRVEKIEASESWWAARRKQRASSPDDDGSDDAESDDDAPRESNDEPQRSRSHHPKTRAQRNKLKRQRATEAERAKAKALKAQQMALLDVKKVRRGLDEEEREHAARRAARAAAATLPSLPTTPPAVALSDDLLDSHGILRKNKALQSPADLLRGFALADAVAKHQPPKKRGGLIERKKPPRRKYRGAKLINRYRKPWLAVA